MATLAAGGLAEHETLIAKQLSSKESRRQEVALNTLCKALDGAALAKHADAMLKLLSDLKINSPSVVKAFEKLGPKLADHVDALVALIGHPKVETRVRALRVLAKCDIRVRFF